MSSSRMPGVFFFFFLEQLGDRTENIQEHTPVIEICHQIGYLKFLTSSNYLVINTFQEDFMTRVDRHLLENHF